MVSARAHTHTHTRKMFHTDEDLNMHDDTQVGNEDYIYEESENTFFTCYLDCLTTSFLRINYSRVHIQSKINTMTCHKLLLSLYI